MGGNPVLPAWDALVLILPILGFLGMYIFGLDELLAAPKNRPRMRRFFCEAVGKGTVFLSDPDGKPWQKGGCGQLEARLTRVDYSE